MAKEEDRQIEVSHITIRQSISLMVGRLMILEVIFTLFRLIYFVLQENVSIVGQFDVFFIVAMSIMEMCLTAIIILHWVNEYYEITPHLINHKSGLIYEKKQQISFKSIREMALDQGVMGRFLNFGTIRFYDYDVKAYKYLYLIHNPVKYFKIIKKLRPDIDAEIKTIRRHLIETDTTV